MMRTRVPLLGAASAAALVATASSAAAARPAARSPLAGLDSRLPVTPRTIFPEFKKDDSGRVLEAAFHQPGATYVAKRKQ